MTRPCSACGTPMTRGYGLVKKPDWGARQTPVEAWVCRAAGCGLGKFIGNVLTTTRGLRKLELKTRPRPRGGNAMATEDEPKNEHRTCPECGKNDSPMTRRGICRRCAARKKYRERKGGNVKPRRPRAVGPGGAGARTVALTVYVPEGVHARLVAVAAFLGTAPAELVAELVAKRFEGAKA